MKNTNKLLKTAAFTDIHWGCKSNSNQHNTDCDNYIDWFCDNVRNDPEIDNIIFLGDWFENRSAINISTMKFAYNGAKKLNDLGLPIYFIVGNHDLYYRHSREIHSLINYESFDNFHIIDKPTVVDEISNGILVCPYLFGHEYPSLKQYTHLDTWWGHFEFRGFVITGYNVTMPTGPDANDYAGPKHIVSGHFHKRQANGAVVFMGNTFPTNYGDAGDTNRGMMTYDHGKDDMLFYNWDECPVYTKTILSDLIEDETILCENARVKCVVDIPISFEESTALRERFVTKYNLREFTLEESPEIRAALQGVDMDLDCTEDTELASVDDLVLRMLDDIDSTHFDTEMLSTIYQKL